VLDHVAALGLLALLEDAEEVVGGWLAVASFFDFVEKEARIPMTGSGGQGRALGRLEPGGMRRLREIGHFVVPVGLCMRLIAKMTKSILNAHINLFLLSQQLDHLKPLGLWHTSLQL